MPPIANAEREDTMSLQDELAGMRTKAAELIPAEKFAVMQDNIAKLRKSGITSSMLKKGDKAPAIRLGNAAGKTIDVADLLKTGPVVINFYRGGWCPYCNLELRAFQKLLPEIAATGASLVAISPEKPDASLSTAEKNELTFEVLSDVGQTVGRAFGLVYTLSDELQAIYNQFGNDLAVINGTPDEWALPVPATYVIGQDGTILYAHADVDYQHRGDPQEVLAVLKNAARAA
jgi:peroxiredoxin